MSTPQPPTFEAFRQQALAAGYDEALLREWEPNFANETHTHPFDMRCTHAKACNAQLSLAGGPHTMA